ncbi:Ldh family oxidoreductase [Streptomyces achromogenes]|uniref:Ldh family oxidoreductase n=1 Tax=Streptomyces achromogenes TaxID=67255 RepID=UPI003421CB10
MVDTSLRGIAPHGPRLLGQYLDGLSSGVADARARITVVRDKGAGLLLDVDGALGVLAGLAAARDAAERAARFGVAAVDVRASDHFGAASVSTRRLTRKGLVGLAVTSAASRVAPFGGYKGQGLAMAVTLLGAVLTGMPPDWRLSQVGAGTAGRDRHVGHFVPAIDPAAFAGEEQFTAHLAELLDTVRTAPRAGQEPVLAHERRRRATGIPPDAGTARRLAGPADRLGVPGPVGVPERAEASAK